MAATIKIVISIQTALFDQIEILAQRHHLSRGHLIEIAIEQFLQSGQSQTKSEEIIQHEVEHFTLVETAGAGREANQGDIYWVPLDANSEAELGYTHPHVIIQDNIFNRSRINTVVVCALTSNLKRAKSPGHVLLEAGEANLSRQSVVVVSQVSTVDKTQLGEYIGTLSQQRIDEILAGMRFLQLMTKHHDS